MGKPGPAARKLAGFRREADRTHKELEVTRATVAAKQEAYDKAAHDYGDKNKDFKLAKAEADRLEPSGGYFGTTDEADRYAAAQDRKYAAQRASSEARKAMKRAEAELDAAKSDVDDKRGAAELADLELQDARDAADAEEAAAKRAAERDHPEEGAEPEVDLDADDAVAVRADATAAREAAETGYAAEATRIAKERDPAAREKWAADQELKAAEMQVKGQQKALDQARNEVGSLNREADRYAKTDPARAEHLRERARTAATDQQVAEARIEDSKRAVETAREVAQRQAEVLTGLEDQQRDLQQKRGAAERAIDGLEERARLLEEAQRKFAEANRSGDEKLRTDAEGLVQRAERVHVDRVVIEEIAPDLPTAPQSNEPQAAAAEPMQSAGESTSGAQDPEVVASSGAQTDDADVVGDDGAAMSEPSDGDGSEVQIASAESAGDDQDPGYSSGAAQQGAIVGDEVTVGDEAKSAQSDQDPTREGEVEGVNGSDLDGQHGAGVSTETTATEDVELVGQDGQAAETQETVAGADAAPADGSDAGSYDPYEDQTFATPEPAPAYSETQSTESYDQDSEDTTV